MLPAGVRLSRWQAVQTLREHHQCHRNRSGSAGHLRPGSGRADARGVHRRSRRCGEGSCRAPHRGDLNRAGLTLGDKTAPPNERPYVERQAPSQASGKGLRFVVPWLVRRRHGIEGYAQLIPSQAEGCPSWVTSRSTSTSTSGSVPSGPLGQLCAGARWVEGRPSGRAGAVRGALAPPSCGVVG